MPEREFLAAGVIRGDWWQVLDDGRVQCDLCPRHCRMREGQRGFCFVRQARDGAVALASYGRASGFCIDPIEKKPLNHFLPGTPILSFGTAGCNLGCKFCQNWSISKAREDDRLMAQALPDAVTEAALIHGCRSLAFTYNDPVIFAEYAIDCAIAAHEHGLKTVAVTAGYMTPQARSDFYRHIDAANIDLKAFTEGFYSSLCFAALGPVLDTLRWLKHETEVWFEVTTLLIPGENDSPDEVDQLCDWTLENLGDEVPLHFSAFHPDFKMRHIPPTPKVTLKRAREQALRAGLKHVYTGNVHHIEGDTTTCTGCGQALIIRDWYNLRSWNLTPDGTCPQCGTVLAGVFEAEPGSWGARRQVIQIG